MTSAMPSALFLADRDTRWAGDALCVDLGYPDAWFPEPPHHDLADMSRYRKAVGFAQAICADCPVRQECLDDALSRGERHGIWGGVDMHETRKMKRAS